MSTTTRPSAGALRAARAILEDMERDGWEPTSRNISHIIDKESGLAEAVEALQKYEKWCRDDRLRHQQYANPIRDNIFDDVRRVLARIEGKDEA